MNLDDPCLLKRRICLLSYENGTYACTHCGAQFEVDDDDAPVTANILITETRQDEARTR